MQQQKMLNWINTFDGFFDLFQGESTSRIVGIKHIDLKSHPVSVAFVHGGIGENAVIIFIKSQFNHGINSIFTFYGWKKKCLYKSIDNFQQCCTSTCLHFLLWITECKWMRIFRMSIDEINKKKTIAIEKIILFFV